MSLKKVLRQKIEAHRPRTTRLMKEFGKVKIDEDIICQTKLGYETSVVLGEQIGKKMQ